MTCSEQTGTEADEEVRKLIGQCQKKAIELIERNSEVFERIIERLMEKESIDGEEFMELTPRGR